MSIGSSFRAQPGKRTFAALFDALVVCACFLGFAVAGEALGVSISTWDAFGAVFFVYHSGCLIALDGRTLGKIAVNICVIARFGRPLSARASVIRAAIRTWPFFLFDIPHIENLLDLNYGPFWGVCSLTLMLLVETILLEISPTGHTLADRLSGSIVVNLPPPQPHRAPAGPAYSPTDAEFGSPPSKRKPDR
jgi:uncharacterized RDD family membrane protein YckC